MSRNREKAVDAIKHQAKTVTVGTSRITEKVEGIIFDQIKEFGFNISQIANKNIIVLKNGKIVEQGTHKELVEMKNEYFNLVKNQLEEIFTIEVKDKKRLEFWKKYISYIKKVEFYKGLNQAIIMETASHTFIEFGEKGNAFYVYNLENLKKFVFLLAININL